MAPSTSISTATSRGATATPRKHQHTPNHLPLSPPPSPQPTTTRRRRKRVDSFAQLAAATPLPSPLSSPGLQAESEAESESLLTRILLTPLLFTSFLLSLFLVNHHNRSRRAAAHPSSSSSLFASFIPTRWLDPEPYQNQADSTWSQRAVGYDGTMDGGAAGRKRWHFNDKIRKMARLEVTDAFEIRYLVMASMVVVWLGICAAVYMGLRWLWGALVAA